MSKKGEENIHMTRFENHAKRKAAEGSVPPPLMEAVLTQSTASDSFRQRCEDAALAGLAVVQIRKQQQKSKFRAKSFGRWIQQLKKAAGSHADRVERYYGFDKAESERRLRGMLRCAADIGLSMREAIVTVKMEAADWQDLSVVPHRIFPKGEAAQLTLTKAEEALDEMRRSHAAQVDQVFQKIESLAREEFAG